MEKEKEITWAYKWEIEGHYRYKGACEKDRWKDLFLLSL